MGRTRVCVVTACAWMLSACVVEDDARAPNEDGRRSGIREPGASFGPTAAELLERIASCDQIVGGPYRMAELLGIDPDPRVGGTEEPVSYIAFTGEDARVEIIEDHDEATSLGLALAGELLAAP